MNIQQTLQQAFQYLNSGNLLLAAQLFELVLQREPQNFAALNGRGFISLQQNRLAQSVEDFKKSLAINPKQVFAQKMLAIVLGALGRFEDSMQAFEAALDLDPKDPEIYFNRANFLYQAGLVSQALEDLDEAIKLKPSYLEARSNRANVLMMQEAYDRAEKDLIYLTDRIKNNPDLWVALGLSQHRMGKGEKALLSNRRALKLNPRQFDALLNNAGVAYDSEDFFAAADWAKKAIEAAPSRSEAYYALGNPLYELGQLEESIEQYNKSIALNPSYADAFMGRGRSKAALRDFVGAEADYDHALSLKPDFDDAVFNKGYMQLEQHQFSEGWRGYEHRLRFPKFKDSLLPGIPFWDGAVMPGKLLVRGEQQGLGDSILFISVLPDLINLRQSICLQVEPRLVTLMQRSFPNINVCAKSNEAPPGVIAQIPLGSLPKFFRMQRNDFQKARIPYLKADSIKAKQFRELIAPNGEKIIGVNWRSFKNRFAREKSLELLELRPIFLMPGCVFVNLQYGDTKEEVAKAAEAGMIFSRVPSIDLTNDIDSVASLVDACDEIVSVSNSTVHLAGALGKKVALMLPYRIGKLWYWSEAKGGGSLWYPTVKTYHQSAQGDWTGTIAQVVADLQK